MEHNVILPAEWYPQSAVQLTWPHENTDWAPILDEVIPCPRIVRIHLTKNDTVVINLTQLFTYGGLVRTDNQ